MNFIKKLFSPTLPASIQTLLNEKVEQLSLPDLNTGSITVKAIQSIEFKNKTLQFQLNMPFAAKSLWPSIEQSLTTGLLQHEDIEQVNITFETVIDARMTQNTTGTLEGIKNIIAVASGKGGVGKSTTCVNLALALQQEGAQVAILDADIYGPSIPTMLGSHDKPDTLDGKSMEPIKVSGLQLMSIGFLIDQAEPMVWRGPMVTQTLIQLLNETHWQDIDYLLIDLPPGTGDIQLTLSQQIPVTGAIVVTTPQEVALIDARKGLKMFEKVNIPILGIIENMSTHICSNCGHEEAIFGEDGGKVLAEESGTTLLAQLPLEAKLRASMDSGNPIVLADPMHAISQTYKKVAQTISCDMATQRKSYANVFPKITVENS